MDISSSDSSSDNLYEIDKSDRKKKNTAKVRKFRQNKKQNTQNYIISPDVIDKGFSKSLECQFTNEKILNIQNSFTNESNQSFNLISEKESSSEDNLGKIWLI